MTSSYAASHALGGTGSIPPAPNGLQRRIRQTARAEPLDGAVRRGSRPRRSGSTWGRSGTGRRATPTAWPVERGSARSATARTGAPAATGCGARRSSRAPSPARRSSSVISATRSCVFAPRIASRATRTTSFPSSACGATYARPPSGSAGPGSAATAPPTRRAATTAIPPEPGREKHYHPRSVRRIGRRRTPVGPRAIAARRRTSDGEARAALAAAATTGSRGRRGCACAGGSRAPSRGGGCSAGRCACPWPCRDPRSMRRPARAPAGPRVYGPRSTQDKGLDNRKCVKTPLGRGRVENPCAIVRPPPPAANPCSATTAPDRHPPDGFSTVVERSCG